MSRLLFAAARGARIQFYGLVGDYEEGYQWYETERIPLAASSHGYYRIHPDDEHLQYGPISSALRELAMTDNFPYTLSACGAQAMLLSECKDHANDLRLAPDVTEVKMFALILAEALADEGL